MRKRALSVIACFTLLLTLKGKAQDTTKIKSLNAFFAGIPITEGADSCKQFILTNPLFGIDSINEKGSIYSSPKSGMKDHFPFPDSVQVKISISLYKGWTVPVLRTLPMNTQIVSITALFGTGKSSGKASTEVYK